LVVVEYLSLDGVIQAPGHAGEDRDGGFAHGGWTGGFMADHQRRNSELFPAAGAFLMGRRTYEIFAAVWPAVTDERDPIARGSTAGPSTWCPPRCAWLPGPEQRCSPAMSPGRSPN
jgi:dihydrofolate reductase